MPWEQKLLRETSKENCTPQNGFVFSQNDKVSVIDEELNHRFLRKNNQEADSEEDGSN